MKRILMLVGLLAATTTANSEIGADIDASIIGSLQQRRPEDRTVIARPEKPNEIQINNKVYSGIAVQFIKTDNPLQLINPAAPPEYGSPEQNVSRDPITGKVSGLKLFAIQF